MMFNSYFNLPTYTLGEQQFKDIFAPRKNVKFNDLFISDNEDAWYYVVIPDNMLLEQIAYEQYDDSSYWDLLFMINQMDTPFDLPKTQDLVVAEVEKALEEWLIRFPNFPQSLIDDASDGTLGKRNLLMNEYTDINEKHRKFRCVKKSYLNLLYKAINEL